MTDNDQDSRGLHGYYVEDDRIFDSARQQQKMAQGSKQWWDRVHKGRNTVRFLSSPYDDYCERKELEMKKFLFDMFQYIATGLAVFGVVLNNARDIDCFVYWIASNLLCLAVHWRARLWGMVVRDVIFTILAVMGWIQWS